MEAIVAAAQAFCEVSRAVRAALGDVWIVSGSCSAWRTPTGGTTTTDKEAVRLLREHGILSMATWGRRHRSAPDG